MRSSSMKTLCTLGATLLLLSGAQAADVKVIAGAAFAPAMKELGPQFERATGHRLVVEYGILGALQKRMDSSEEFDVAIVPAALLDAAARQGRIAAGTRAGLVRVGMAVAVRAGAPKPDIGSVDAFSRALTNASRIAYPPEGAIGVHLDKVLSQLGIADQMKLKTRALKTVEMVAPTLAAGEAELGFAPSTVLAGAAGVEVVGPFPPELQSYVQLNAGVAVAAAQPDAARSLIKHLTSPEAVAVFKAKGFEPSSGK